MQTSWTRSTNFNQPKYLRRVGVFRLKVEPVAHKQWGYVVSVDTFASCASETYPTVEEAQTASEVFVERLLEQANLCLKGEAA